MAASDSDRNNNISCDESQPLLPRVKISRQASVILPSTGERVRRQVTLSNIHYCSMNEPDVVPLNYTNTTCYSQLIHWISYYIVLPLRIVYFNSTVRNVIKSSIAYFIASLAVYWIKFDDLLGETDSKHVVATVAVYFHPSRTIGSMHQTAMFVIICILFSFTVSFACRAISVYLFVSGSDELSYALDLFVSSIALGTIAFFKQKVNMATFNTACSLASITVVSLLVREGSLNASQIPVERLMATLRVIFCGTAVSVGCCYFIWPVRAVDKLRKSLNDSYDIMSSILSILTNCFLVGETVPDEALFIALKSNVSQLQQYIVETKYELRLKGRETEWLVLDKIVSTTIALSIHLQALRTSVEMQYKLLHDTTISDDSDVSSLESYRSEIIRISQSVENMSSLNHSLEHSPQNAAQLFDLFVDYLTPSIKSFIFTIKGILSEIPFERYSKEFPDKFARTTNLQHSLQISTELFHSKQTESFAKLYDQDIFKKSADFIMKAGQEEVTACCGNFISLLGLFADELLEFLKLAETYEDSRCGTRSWKWLKFWKSVEKGKTKKHSLAKESSTFNAALSGLQNQYRFKPKFRNDIEKTSFSYNLWKFLKVFRRVDVQFGIRVGLGAFVISIFAFIPQTKETFLAWRGEWSVTIFCIMMNKSLGGTTMTVKWRLIGTFLGSFIAYLVWVITEANVFALAITGFLISLWSFYIILYWKQNNAFGRFILLTYNLTALYSFSMFQHDSEDDNEGGDDPIIAEIAFHRFAAVSFGIFCALTMASLFLPNSARSRLKRGLILLWLRLGVVWNSEPLAFNDDDLLIGLKGLEGTNDMLGECETLLKQAPLEFRLKGKFPKDSYSRLIRCTWKIVDAYQNMNLMIKVDPIVNENERYVLKYLESERSEVEHRLFLIFYTIASAMKLGIPLPNKPASPQHAKDRMLYKLSEIRSQIAETPNMAISNEDFILLYSYILVTSSITEQLDNISYQVKHLLGDVTEDIFQLA